MKPVLIQALHRHNQKKKHVLLSDVDSVHGGPRDRSGFIIFLVLIMTIIAALILE
jgi:hypothetical protein